MAGKKSARKKPAARFSRAQLLWLLPVFLIPFWLHTTYILNAFYHYGAVFFDTGWLANTIWHNNWMLKNPFQYADYSILLVHVYLIAELLNLLSYVVPLPMPEFYAAVNGSIYAGLAVMMFIGLWFCTKPKAPAQTAFLALLAVGFAFNGVVMQGMWMTHLEYAIPLGMFAFFLCRALNRPRLAIAAFILTVIMREDAGFHIAGILILLALIEYYKTRSLKALKPEILWITAACGYSLVAWMGSTWLRAAQPQIPHSLFVMTYLGSPPYAHLNWDLLAKRACTIFAERTYIWLPALISFAWACHKRDLVLAVGFAAFIPWFLLNWTAVLENTGLLYAYYAFPFIVGLGWPVIAALWRHGTNVPHKLAQETLVLQAVLVVVALVVWNPAEKTLAFGPHFWAQWGSYAVQEGTMNRKATQDFADKLHGGSTELGALLGDGGTMSLLASPMNGREIRPLDDKTRAFDSLIYFNPFNVAPAKEVQEQVKRHYWPYHYCIEGTPICVFSNRAPDQLDDFSLLLARKPAAK